MDESQTQTPSFLFGDPIFVFFIGFLLIIYFMSIRPQQKKMKALQTMMDDLEKGDEVVAAGGIIGRIKDIKGPYVSIEVSENITFKLQKTAIANTLPKGTIASID
ncbi:preprotein translocase subunit YajC [Gammaproteobacteria bacterium]|nr:preprotein translocase subunit YajC [Gammaproteobacteria bacterium]MDB4243406.1 preprotein translocase subunit YajC [Gammaproteobacteria bacterium]MDC0090980.1 preprotein translocase subunit YajC [Gammaproteobacteria bacterium]MDC1387751.1 preprotein translocase subunit YajC [Gammaproteobacteria bacterium]